MRLLCRTIRIRESTGVVVGIAAGDRLREVDLEVNLVLPGSDQNVGPTAKALP